MTKKWVRNEISFWNQGISGRVKLCIKVNLLKSLIPGFLDSNILSLLNGGVSKVFVHSGILICKTNTFLCLCLSLLSGRG